MQSAGSLAGAGWAATLERSTWELIKQNGKRCMHCAVYSPTMEEEKEQQIIGEENNLPPVYIFYTERRLKIGEPGG